jgi:1-acyl-sn-glycerol-3-phosphate acyltransferase
MASTPAEESGGQPPLSLPRYRPWFYDLVRIASATFLLPFRLSASGLENVPAQGGVVLAPMHRSYVDSLAVGE